MDPSDLNDVLNHFGLTLTDLLLLADLDSDGDVDDTDRNTLLGNMNMIGATREEATPMAIPS